MTLMSLRLLVARAEVMALVKTALFSVVLVALAPPLYLGCVTAKRLFRSGLPYALQRV